MVPLILGTPPPLSSHVDDLGVFATRRGLEDRVKKMEAEGLKLKVEGPLQKETFSKKANLSRCTPIAEASTQ